MCFFIENLYTSTIFCDIIFLEFYLFNFFVKTIYKTKKIMYNQIKTK